MGPNGAHLGPTAPRWAPCWPHELCSLGRTESHALKVDSLLKKCCVCEMMYIFDNKLGLHWFRLRKIAYYEPSHCLKKFRLIVVSKFRKTFQRQLNRNTKIVIAKNKFVLRGLLLKGNRSSMCSFRRQWTSFGYSIYLCKIVNTLDAIWLADLLAFYARAIHRPPADIALNGPAMWRFDGFLCWWSCWKTVALPAICDAMILMWCHRNGIGWDGYRMTCRTEQQLWLSESAWYMVLKTHPVGAHQHVWFIRMGLGGWY